MEVSITVTPKVRPVLDEGFVPASLWNRAYRECVRAEGGKDLALALERGDRSVAVFRTRILAGGNSGHALNLRYVERLLKFLLWQKGAWRITVAGDSRIAAELRTIYSPGGARAFDGDFMGELVYGKPLEIREASFADLPEEREPAARLGGHLDGFRVGFDLGASSRKCAAVANGEVLFSEEVHWNPDAQADPQYHFHEIHDSIRRAAAKLPRVDAIGGSAAGVYVANEVRVGSIYRAVPRDLFDRRIRRLFFDLRKAWGDVPFEVLNDGEVTALAGSAALGQPAVLGLSMGSSLAAGFVTPQGAVTTWLNELAFAPVDFRPEAPADEWSGDRGVGVEYFSQHAVARLLPAAGIELPAVMPLPEKLAHVQELMAAGDRRARQIYETIGVYLGYELATYAEFYDARHILLLGGVSAGEGGNVIASQAVRVLREEFPELAGRIRVHIPEEKERRHGQAVAAARLPEIPKPGAHS